MNGYAWLFVGLLAVSSPVSADLLADLKELKAICDQGLLTTDECAEQRRKILAKHDSGEPEWFCNYFGEQTRATALSDSSKMYSESTAASAIEGRYGAIRTDSARSPA
jgi:hypothetical protein